MDKRTENKNEIQNRLKERKKRNSKKISNYNRNIKSKKNQEKNIINKDEEIRIRKRTNLICSLLLALMVFSLITGITDFIKYKKNKLPVFTINFKAKPEERLRVYYGLGYKIIKFNNFEEKDMKFGSWLMRYKNPNEDNLKYNERKEINVYKLQMIEDIEKISKKEEEIPENPDKYIKENQDLFNQIKERENASIYALELILHSADTSVFDKYILAKIIVEKNENLKFKFKDHIEFLNGYSDYLDDLNLEEYGDESLEKISYDLIFKNPEIN